MKHLSLTLSLLLLLSAPARAQDSLAESWGKAMDATAEAFSKTADKAGQTLTEAADSTSKALGKAADATSEALGKAKDATLDAVEKGASATMEAVGKARGKQDGNQPKAAEPAPEEACGVAEPAAITAHDLLKAFTDDPGAAEKLYLGKTVRIKGIVLSTGISRYMTPNVELSDRAGGTLQAVCVLPRLDADKLSGFTPGRSVTMSGRVYKHFSGRMVIKDCIAAP
ncbi:MAG: OB-fold putative lipoprotein [Deltaproteobacteria bacterium]|nr:OB-fold putative lipoprotein [Deltaproteobacteria bacterium]